MNLIAKGEPIPYWGKIAEKSLFAQTQTPCHDRDLTETRMRRFAGWCDQVKTEAQCDSWETVHQSPQTFP